jgi:hypothetical protein
MPVRWQLAISRLGFWLYQTHTHHMGWGQLDSARLEALRSHQPSWHAGAFARMHQSVCCGLHSACRPVYVALNRLLVCSPMAWRLRGNGLLMTAVMSAA